MSDGCAPAESIADVRRPLRLNYVRRDVSLILEIGFVDSATNFTRCGPSLPVQKRLNEHAAAAASLQYSVTLTLPLNYIIVIIIIIIVSVLY